MSSGKPAATVGSLTAHGGGVTQGAPNVLIAGKPAARQGDPHVCPMCNPNGSPHVGGSIASGAANVLIAGQPAATVGSSAVCAGPPDLITQGAPNVRIAQGGSGKVAIGGNGRVEIGGSGGQVIIGGGSGGPSAESQAAEATAARMGLQQARAQQASGVDVSREGVCARAQLVGWAGEPLRREHVEHAEDGEENGERLPSNGELRNNNLPAAQEQAARAQGLGHARWSKEEAAGGEEVTVRARAFGVEEGTAAQVAIYRSAGGEKVLVAQREGEVAEGRVEASWTYEHDDRPGAPEGVRAPEATAPPRLERPTYVAKVHLRSLTATTGPLMIRTRLELEVTNAQGERLAHTSYRLHLADGTVRTGTTDGQAKLREQDVPLPDAHELVAQPSEAN